MKSVRKHIQIGIYLSAIFLLVSCKTSSYNDSTNLLYVRTTIPFRVNNDEKTNFATITSNNKYVYLADFDGQKFAIDHHGLFGTTKESPVRLYLYSIKIPPGDHSVDVSLFHIDSLNYALNVPGRGAGPVRVRFHAEAGHNYLVYANEVYSGQGSWNPTIIDKKP